MCIKGTLEGQRFLIECVIKGSIPNVLVCFIKKIPKKDMSSAMFITLLMAWIIFKTLSLSSLLGRWISHFSLPLLQMQLSYDPVCPSVGRSVSHYFPKGREFLPYCSNRSTCLVQIYKVQRRPLMWAICQGLWRTEERTERQTHGQTGCSCRL